MPGTLHTSLEQTTALLGDIGTPHLNDSGKVAFDGVVSGGVNGGIGIIATKNPNEDLELVAVAGMTPPETNGAFDFTFFRDSRAALVQ